MGRRGQGADGPARRSEREVQAEWAAGNYRGATLMTAAGESYAVVYQRNRPNAPAFGQGDGSRLVPHYRVRAARLE